MNKLNVQAKFDSLAPRYAANYDSRRSQGGSEYTRRMELLRDFAVTVRPHTILDAGCGPGIVLSALSRRLPNARLVGMDLSTLMLKEAAANGFSTGRLLRADVEKLPFGASSFDLVCALGVVNFLDEPANFFGSVHRVLKPGGHFAFTYPNKHCIHRTLAVFLKACLRRSRHAVAAIAVKRASVEQMLASCGLELLDTRFITFRNGFVSFPWPVSLNFILEKFLGRSGLGAYFAWSCFCIACKPAEEKAVASRTVRRPGRPQEEKNSGSEASVCRIGQANQRR